MSKQLEYTNLVKLRKTCTKCNGLSNPIEIVSGQFDSEQIGPWSLWQGNLDSEILIVGQDWGDANYFRKWQGIDQPKNNPTNENLQKLLYHIGVNIKKPREKQNQILFFTNLILCLKSGGLQAPINNDWLKNCSRIFFKPLVDIINPKVIISLSRKVTDAILDLHEFHYQKSASYTDIVQRAPYMLTEKRALFPVFHCGAGSVNRNRSLQEQYLDWDRIRNWIKAN